MQHDRPHALVVGASLAGMLAARVLSETCERVTVLDRDLWTDHARPRQGVPHGGHAHGLLSRGLAGLEELLPGLTAELVRAGGVIGDISEGVAWTLAGGRLAAAPSDLVGLLVSRVALESAVRRRVLELPQVTLHEHRAAAGITLSPSGDVDGVEVFATDGPPGPITRIAADVVVDASGRRSQAAAWLRRHGYPAPPQDRVGVDIHYATRWFERRPGDLGGLVAAAHGATPDAPFGAVALAQEGDRWVVGLNGYHGRRPPVDLADFRARARRTDPLIGELVSGATPLDDGARFGLKAAVWNRYDRARRVPGNFLVIGDAVCSFNPIYGQGISVAVSEALVLRDSLAAGRPDLGRRFHRGSRPAIATAWQLSTGNDLALPATVGRRTRAGSLIGGYVHALLVAARTDANLAHAFLRVSNLEAEPSSLLAPRLALRVLRSSLAPAPRPATMRPVAGGAS
jgi:2-polyprenyl-6-methoxyphenol hydroxylase-like FAD-dependent oxidoreductase